MPYFARGISGNNHFCERKHPYCSYSESLMPKYEQNTSFCSQIGIFCAKTSANPVVLLTFQIIDVQKATFRSHPRIVRTKTYSVEGLCAVTRLVPLLGCPAKKQVGNAGTAPIAFKMKESGISPDSFILPLLTLPFRNCWQLIVAAYR